MAGSIDKEDWRTAMAAFLDQPGKWDWLASWARASECLPIYCDWTHAFGVTADGEVIAWEYEPWPEVSGVPTGRVTDAHWLNVALHQGKERYPWLAVLLPACPIDAQTCSMCGGTGRCPVAAMICYCGGAGWVPASDTWVNRERLRS
jgi:hypothetical protein